jgi:carboxyl-terminal processing protease
MAVGASIVAGIAAGLSNYASGEGTAQSLSNRIDSVISARHPDHKIDVKPGPDPYICYQTVMSVLRRSYYGQQIDAKRTRAITYEAIKGMLASLNDQFSGYLDAAQWHELVTMTEGRFGGIGALLEQSGETIRISRPAAGGAADKAGLHAGDVLISIDGNPVKGHALDDLGQWLEGDLQTAVNLEIMRGATRMTVRVVRENIEPPIVEAWMEDNSSGIGHIVLTEFNRKSVSQIDTAYSDLEKRGLRGLVLDLRFNPGGLLDAAVDVASIFIPQNLKPQLRNNVVIMRNGDGEEEGLTLEPPKTSHRKVPLVVLVNGSSASAAEIVTGAVRDYGTGVIIGERTFGKGKVQTLFEMNHGRDGGIRLTTSIYYPPKRYDINFLLDEEGNRVADTGGIVPDLVVPASANWHGDFDDKVNDNQLKAAVGYLKARLAGSTAVEATRIALGR